MRGSIIHRHFRTCMIGAAMFSVTVGCDTGDDESAGDESTGDESTGTTPIPQ